MIPMPKSLRAQGLTGALLGFLGLALVSSASAAGDGFLPNAGQTDVRVQYFGTSPLVDIYFTADSVVLDVKDSRSLDQARSDVDLTTEALSPPARDGQALYLTFPGARKDARIEVTEENPTRYSFFFGNDPGKWVSNQASFRTVTYRNLWDGVDLVFSLDQGRLSYRLVGQSPDARLEWQGADEVRTTPEGTELATAFGTFLDSGSSIVRQSDDPADDLEFAVRGAGALLWSTLIGGSGNDEGATLAIAPNGDVIMAGETSSIDFPGTPGAYHQEHYNSQDLFVSRFSAEGSTLVWSTYLGSSQYDYMTAITLDGSGNPIVGGRTQSSGYPTTAGAYDTSFNGYEDAVLTKLSSDGASLIFSTFLGGSGPESIFDLLPDANGDLVCAGYTGSADFPVTPGAYQTVFAGLPYDMTVSILSADGSTLLASTFIGGSGRDACRGVAIDASGDFFLAGFTFSADFPVTPGAFQTVKGTIDDAALVKISGDLSTVLWATFLGGNDSERALCLDLDSSGDPFLAGYTSSSDFPTSAGVIQEADSPSMDAFVAKFSNADGARQWSTYLGGSGGEEIVSLLVDASDNPVVTGWTSSPNFPVNNLGFDETHNGSDDIFVTQVAPDGSDVLWSTFLGGSGSDHGLELALDADDNPVVVGGSSSANFPVSAWAYDQTPNGGNDAILARFDTGDAHLALAVSDPEIGCGTATNATFTYNPDLTHSPAMRGYSVRILAPDGLTFAASDITVLSPMVGVNDTFQILENGPGDFTIDFTFLDQGAALEASADLFSIDFSGTAEGTASLDIASAQFRDLDNHLFDVDILDTVDVLVDCTAPEAPTMVAEPVFTAGTVNLVAWSDESASGAVAYNVQASDQSDFSSVLAESGFQGGLDHEFTGLTSGVTYFFRAIGRDANDQDSPASAAVSSTQDADAPVSSLAALPALVGTGFALGFTATDTLSGVASVEIFYNHEGGPFASAGTFATSPAAFTATEGDGSYGFYCVATDSVGNLEIKAATAEITTVVDTSAPEVPTLQPEPLFTAGEANTVASSDESGSGAVAYNFQVSQLPDFSEILAESGQVATLTHEFSGLADGTTYFFRAAAIDELGNQSTFSAAVSSTQDAAAPTSTASPLTGQNTLTFGVPFTAVDAGVGVATVELFASYEGGAFASFGTFGASPIAFSAGAGEGVYGFYTLAVDSLGNAEIPGGAAQVTCLVDVTAPESNLAALAPFQISGIFPVSASGTDNLAGVASYELFYSLDGGPWTSAGTSPDGSFSFIAPSDGAFGFYSLATDSLGNTEAAPFEADATTAVDTNGPTGTFAINAGVAATNDTTVTLDLTISGALEMRFSNDNLTFDEGWVPFATAHDWTLAGVPGTSTVYGEFRDQAGNLLQTSDAIEFDLTPAGPVTGLTLSHGHQTVSVSWQNPEDADLAQVEIWRGLQHDGTGDTVYPDYVGGVVPVAPASRADALASPDWELAGSIGGGAEAFADTVVTRGIYYYEVFTVDIAGNFSSPNGLLPATTNYILGDMAETFDGLVSVVDLTVLGATYGLADGEAGFNKHADVGPTQNFSASGIPQPDDFVNFEDLMISALNYNLPGKAGGPGAKAGGPVTLGWTRNADDSFTLSLLNAGTGLKGLNLEATLPEGVSATVSAGALCGAQDQPVFLRNIASHGLDAGCALLGTGVSFVGTGVLLTVTLSEGVEPGVLSPENLAIILRDQNNEALEFSFDLVSAADLPSSFVLGGNYPNPFNPSTRISFSLPRQEDVRLEIYGLDGRRVAVLVNEIMPAGAHQVTWTGLDQSGRQVASGVYFYRLRAGEYSDVKKMTLVK